MTQAISADQPLSTRIERVGDQWRAYIDPAWYRWVVDVGDVDLTADVSGILPVGNGGTGVSTSTGSGSVVLANQPTINAEAVTLVTAFLNGWANFGGTFQTAAFYKDSFGVVHLRGLIAGGAVAAPAFVLPVGYRPTKAELFPITSNAAFGEASVTASGIVTVEVGSNVFASLSGITFRT